MKNNWKNKIDIQLQPFFNQKSKITTFYLDFYIKIKTKIIFKKYIFQAEIVYLFGM